MRRPGRRAVEENTSWVAADRGSVLDDPGEQGAQILDAGWPGEGRREPVGRIDRDHAVADGPARDIVMEGRSRNRALALYEATAMDEHEHGPRFARARAERVQALALVRAVRDVARDGDGILDPPRVMLAQYCDRAGENVGAESASEREEPRAEVARHRLPASTLRSVATSERILASTSGPPSISAAHLSSTGEISLVHAAL